MSKTPDTITVTLTVHQLQNAQECLYSTMARMMEHREIDRRRAGVHSPEASTVVDITLHRTVADIADVFIVLQEAREAAQGTQKGRSDGG